MYRLERTVEFEAAHRLASLPEGHKCRRLHGHSYRAVIVLESAYLHPAGHEQAGMVQDYGDIDAACERLLRDYLDHHYLNETLGTDDTTAENVAKWIYDFLEPLLADLAAVRLHETARSCVEYRP